MESARKHVSFSTLWKHEWRMAGRPVWSLIAIQAALIGVHIILNYLPKRWSTGTPFGFITFFHVSAIVVQIALVVVVAVTLMVSYYKSMYGSYSKFTISEPTSPGKILGVKIAWAMLALIVSIVVATLGTMLGFFGVSARDAYSMGVPWESSLATLNNVFTNAPVFVVLIVVISVMIVCAYVCEGAFIVTIAHNERLLRLGRAGAIVIAVVLGWVVRNTITLLALPLIPFQWQITGGKSFINDVDFTTMAIGKLSFVSSVPIGLFVGIALVIAVYYTVTHREVTKHWNL